MLEYYSRRGGGCSNVLRTLMAREKSIVSSIKLWNTKTTGRLKILFQSFVQTICFLTSNTHKISLTVVFLFRSFMGPNVYTFITRKQCGIGRRHYINTCVIDVITKQIFYLTLIKITNLVRWVCLHYTFTVSHAHWIS